MADQLRLSFPDEKQREEQMKAGLRGRHAFAAIIMSVPFYFTWLILSIVCLKDDVSEWFISNVEAGLKDCPFLYMPHFRSYRTSSS